MSQYNDVIRLQASFTRPSDTTTYAIGDAMTNSTSAPSVLTFSGVAPWGSHVMVIGVTIHTSSAPTLSPFFDLRLFNTTFTAVNDNSAFTLTDAEGLTGAGGISVFSVYTATNNQQVSNHALATPIKLRDRLDSDASTSGSLFGMLVAANAYVPTSAEVFTIGLFLDRL